MRTELGAVFSFSPDEVSPADFAGCRLAHIEGYIVFNRALADAVISSARAAGCKVSLDVASFEIVRMARDWLIEQLKIGLELVVANEDEIRELFPDLPAKTAEDYAAHALRLASYGGTAAVKLGKDGAWIARGTEVHRIAPVTVSNAIDSNGAGDAWAAGFLSAYLRGLPLATCGTVRLDPRRGNRETHGARHPRYSLARSRRCRETPPRRRLTSPLPPARA